MQEVVSGSTVAWLARHRLLSLLSYTSQARLPQGGPACSGLSLCLSRKYPSQGYTEKLYWGGDSPQIYLQAT